MFDGAAQHSAVHTVGEVALSLIQDDDGGAPVSQRMAKHKFWTTSDFIPYFIVHADENEKRKQFLLMRVSHSSIQC